ncbi:MAG: hypothetical protein ABIT01_10600, partial [Thermoanaerobaculia bacterium]
MSITLSVRVRRVLTALLLTVAVPTPSGAALAQKASAPAKPQAAAKPKSMAGKAAAAPKAKSGGMTSLEAYEKTKAIALKWQPDAELTSLGTLSTFPAGLDGRSEEWSIHYTSKSANKSNLMSVKGSVVTPFEVQGPAGRVIEVQPDTIMDSAKLRQIAEENGGSSFPGSKITIAVVQNRNGPLWHINYQDAEGNELLHLAIEGNGGKAKQ